MQASTGPNRAAVEEALRKSRRWQDFQMFRRYYFYAALASGYDLEQANLHSVKFTIKTCYPDWIDETSTKQPAFDRPTMQQIHEKAASAGIGIGNMTKPKARQEYNTLCTLLQEKDPTFVPADPPRLDPWPNLDKRHDPNALPDPASMLSEADDIMPESTVLADIYWVWENIGTKVSRNKAPSQGAYQLLEWANKSKSEFYKTMAVRVLPSKAQLDRELSKRDRGEASLEFIDRLSRVAEECKVRVI